METEYPSYLICLSSKGEPSLLKKFLQSPLSKSISLQDHVEKISLSGGFSKLPSQSDILLSPALQLNGDLSDYAIDELQNIGLAEYNRLTTTTFRSYIREPDTRVAVLAKDAVSLTNFLETYGAVLDMVPLLIDNYHSDYSTAENLDIEPLPEGCRIQYMVRKPVNLEKCTYCGNCGPVCPEDCLDEQLFIDLSRCTYCNKCITTCPHKAIDLHRAEKYTFDFPALIVLDQPKIEIPEDHRFIFEPNELENLFSSLIPVNIEETISWTASLCQYSSRLNTGCHICLDACRHEAIDKNHEGIFIHHQNCVECGACLASCPTGALQNLRFTDRQFIDWFSKVQPKPDSTIIIGNEQLLHKLWWKRILSDADSVLFLEHPNIKGLTGMHLLFLLSLGAKQVLLLDEPALNEKSPIAKEIHITHSIFKSLFGGEQRIAVTTLDSLPEIVRKNSPSPILTPYRDFTFANRREKFASILSFLIEHSEKWDTLLEGKPFSTFGSVACNSELCTHCGACLNECRIKALTADKDSLSLNHTGILCVQCSTCVEICPENALTLNPGLLLTQGFLFSKELTRAEPLKCLECGKPFGTQKSYERIVAILREKNPASANEDVLEYCETCRVVKMFEAHQQ